MDWEYGLECARVYGDGVRGFRDDYAKRYKYLRKVEKSVGEGMLESMYGVNELLLLSSDFMLYVLGIVKSR